MMAKDFSRFEKKVMTLSWKSTQKVKTSTYLDTIVKLQTSRGKIIFLKVLENRIRLSSKKCLSD